MNLELLTCRRFTAGLVYPPLAVQKADMNRLYALIAERHPYQTLQHLPDGIRMANPVGDCLVQLGRMQMNENVMYFQASKEKCLNIFETVERSLNIQQYLTLGIKLIASLPLSTPAAASALMESRAFGIRSNQWALLGDGRQGVGLRVVLHRDGIYDVRIEPFFNDTSELYVEVDAQYPEPVCGLNGVGKKMDAVYDYMFGNVRDFLATL